MTVVTGKGEIKKNLNLNDVILELRNAQKNGDQYCSVTGHISEGYDLKKIEKYAGYTIGSKEM